MKFRSIVTLFLLSCGFAAAAMAADTPAFHRDDSASEKLGIKLSLQCYTYRALTFFETVDKAAGMGIKYLEIYPGQKVKPGSDLKMTRNMSEETCQEVLKKLESAGGLKVIGYGVDSVPEDEAGARKVFDWAKKMGITVLVTETAPSEMHDKLCNEYQLRWALHNHPTSWPPDKVLEACKDRSKMCGSCADIGHWMRRGWVPLDMLKKLEGRVEHSHFKDLNGMHLFSRDLPWGTGKGGARANLEELKRQGYQGYISIEYETGSVAELDSNLPKCIEFFDKTMNELAK
jgi:sugar phosphate isomerase/epimerase